MEQVNKIIAQYLNAKKQLKELGILRTDRALEGDLAEWLVAKQLNLKLADSNVQKGYDATDDDGKTYQIKSRIVSDLSQYTSFDIKNIDFDFDFLICVFFNPTLEIIKLLNVPRKVVIELGTQNELSFRLRWNKSTALKLETFTI